MKTIRIELPGPDGKFGYVFNIEAGGPVFRAVFESAADRNAFDAAIGSMDGWGQPVKKFKPVQTPPLPEVTEKDRESFAYFLSDPDCKSFKLTVE